MASDGNVLGRQLGVLYTFDEGSKAAALGQGAIFIGDVTGTGTWELPMPTVVVVVMKAASFGSSTSAPDWMVRTEAEPVVHAVQSLQSVPA